MVTPFSHGANLLCKNVVYETKDEIEYSQRIAESLRRFLRLKREFPDLVTIRLTENVPPFGIIAQNLGEGKSSIQIELYSYAVPTRERINFSVNRDNKEMYTFFESQISMLQTISKVCDDMEIEQLCLAQRSN